MYSLMPASNSGVAALLIEGGHIQLQVGALGGLQHHVVVQGVGAQEGDASMPRDAAWVMIWAA